MSFNKLNILNLISKLFIVSLFIVNATAINAQQNSFNIALVAPLSGKYKGYGQELLLGAQQAADHINQQGGIKGLMIKINPFDDHADTNIAIEIANSLVTQQKNHAIIGHGNDHTTQATLPIYAKANLLTIAPMATSIQLAQQNVITFFRLNGNSEQLTKLVVDFILNNLHSKHTAILHDSNPQSLSLADNFAQQLVALQHKPYLLQEFNDSKKSIIGLINKLKQLSIDAIYYPGSYPEVATLAQTLKLYSLQIPIITADGIALPHFFKQAGNSSKGVMMPLPHANYHDRAYASVQVIASAITANNSTDGRALSLWLHQNTVDTKVGRLAWDTNGELADINYQMYIWSSHKYHKIKK